jgi:ABC-type branched-subunit amino acid transport system permease subunit
MTTFLKHPSTVAIFAVLAWALSFAMGHPIDLTFMKWAYFVLGCLPMAVLLLDMITYVLFDHHVIQDKTSIPVVMVPFAWAALFHVLSA